MIASVKRQLLYVCFSPVTIALFILSAVVGSAGTAYGTGTAPTITIDLTCSPDGTVSVTAKANDADNDLTNLDVYISGWNTWEDANEASTPPVSQVGWQHTYSPRGSATETHTSDCTVCMYYRAKANAWDSQNNVSTEITPVCHCHKDIKDIPTVSEWGLIIMALLLLTAGAIVIIRRRRQVAA